MVDLQLVLVCGFLGSLLLLGVAAGEDIRYWNERRRR